MTTALDRAQQQNPKTPKPQNPMRRYLRCGLFMTLCGAKVFYVNTHEAAHKIRLICS